MKNDYLTKEKTATAEPTKVAILPKRATMTTAACILCGKSNVAVKEFTTKGVAGECKVKQVRCLEGNCRYVATYVDGKLV
jgi:hypothetical protein